MVTGPLAAHLLGPTGEGELAAIQTWPLLLATLAMLGLPEALTYYIARDPSRAKDHIGTAVGVALLSYALVASAAWVAMPWLLRTQSGRVIAAARVFLCVGVVFALMGVPHGALRGARRFTAWNLYRVVPGLAWLGVLIGSGAVGHFDAVGLSRWYLFVVAATGLPFLIVVKRALKGSLRPRAAIAPKLVRFGLPSVLTTVPQTVNLRLDQLLIIAFLPSRPLGFYVVAVAWSGATAPLLSAVGSVLFPHVAGESEASERARMLATALQGGAIVATGLAVLLAALAPFLLPLVFGHRFGPAVPSALVLVPAGAILVWAGVAEEGLRGLGHPRLVLAAEGVGAVVTIATLPGLLAAWGILGAAVASLIGYSAVAVTVSVAIARCTDERLSSLVMPTWPVAKDVARRSLSLLRVPLHGAAG
ncbi:oligosaccharide flippase family protein [Acidiferrimicrobium sp. IK]|nr:oligosaccharide flippase family protein [Acidiferrimicrobium sp. IK]